MADIQQARETKSAGLRILFVDDNVDASELLSALLQVDGHEVNTANEVSRKVESWSRRR
jgi:CheY-like chemotaxis protein